MTDLDLNSLRAVASTLAELEYPSEAATVRKAITEVERLRSEREVLLGVLEPAREALDAAARAFGGSPTLAEIKQIKRDCRKTATALEAAPKGVERG